MTGLFLVCKARCASCEGRELKVSSGGGGCDVVREEELVLGGGS